MVAAFIDVEFDRALGRVPGADDAEIAIAEQHVVHGKGGEHRRGIGGHLLVG